MNTYLEKRNEVLAQKTIKGLASRNMSGYYAANKEDALKLALELIPEESSVTMGGCETAVELGLVDALKAGNYNFIDRAEYPTLREGMLKAYDADVYLTSANGMTDDGILINIDGTGNRVSATSYGPHKVIYLVSINKICPDVDSAMKRARNVAAPANAQRKGADTPCVKTGACVDCKSMDTLCAQFLVTRFSREADRVHVILINEDFGF